jgi:peptidyl-prolyl cis-trans isomerase B (cyclophilin B)
VPLSTPRLSRRSAARSLWLTGAAAGATVALAGCGGSHVSSARSGADRTRPAASTTATKDGVCSDAKQPRPKGPQHLRRPTLRLDQTKTYLVRLATNCGAIEIELDVRRTPAVAASFAHLVEIGFYDDLTFHRVVSGFLIQGGDPNGDGSGGPGYTVVERPPSNVRYTKGTVAMAKAEGDPPGMAGSQFFIVTGENVDLPPQYAVLGRVVGGEHTIAAISAVPTTAGPDGEDSAPSTPIVIRSAAVTILERSSLSGGGSLSMSRR